MPPLVCLHPHRAATTVHGQTSLEEVRGQDDDELNTERAMTVLFFLHYLYLTISFWSTDHSSLWFFSPWTKLLSKIATFSFWQASPRSPLRTQTAWWESSAATWVHRMKCARFTFQFLASVVFCAPSLHSHTFWCPHSRLSPAPCLLYPSCPSFKAPRCQQKQFLSNINLKNVRMVVISVNSNV